MERPNRKHLMQNLSPRHVKTEELLRLGVVSGWYSTKVSGTFVSGPHYSEADCLRKIAEINPPAAKKEDLKFAPFREESPMTLVRGNIRGYEHDRMVMLFSMMDGAREIPCAISASAMDDLEPCRGRRPDQREEQFVRLRDRIEAMRVPQIPGAGVRRHSRPASSCGAST